MACRRRHGISRSATFKEEIYLRNDDDPPPPPNDDSGIGDGNGSLAARAMKASAAHRDSAAYGYAYAAADSSPPSSSAAASTSSAYSDSCSHRRSESAFSPLSNSKESMLSNSTSTKEGNDPSKYGFWGILANKAKSILEEDGRLNSSNRMKAQLNDASTGSQVFQPSTPSSGRSRVENAKLRKGLDAITSSLNNLSDSIGNAFEEGRTMVGTKTADIIQETRKLQIRRRGATSDALDQATVVQNSSYQRPLVQTALNNSSQGTQLKASRDVAMATAAKAKVLLRELKSVKAELAFAKQRCEQLEEENKRLRESREKGNNAADDVLIRLQLESLLTEKARLAHENAIHARENRFLREIVEYHRLTMQDIVYLDENGEEVVGEDYPFSIDDAKWLPSTPTSPMAPTFFQDPSLYIATQKREAFKDEPHMACSSSYSHSPTMRSPLGFQPEGTETLEVSSALQTVEEEKREDSPTTKQLNSSGGSHSS